MRAMSLALVTLVVSGTLPPRRPRPPPGLMAKASIWMRRRRRHASQAIRPMAMHRKRRTRLLRRPGRPQRMIASLPIEATRARFQTRPSNWLLQSALIALFAQLISAQEDDEAGGDNRGLQITARSRRH